MKTLNNLPKLNDRTQIVQLLKKHSSPMKTLEGLDPLMAYKGDAKYVFLGEASYGTPEYYT